MYFRALFIALVVLPLSLKAETVHLPSPESQIQVLSGDTIVLRTVPGKVWCRLQPVYRIYDNLSDGVQTLHPIVYQVIYSSEDSVLLPELGTYFYGLFPKGELPTHLEARHPIFNQQNIWQLSVRKEDSYLGYLTELLGLPFVIPPKTITGFGHQTDLRLGTDCAALAVYGRRRMGRSVPYRGPKGIYAFAKKNKDLQPGTILHFGFQVSVLYEDRGQSGVIDAEDILLHAFGDRVQLQAIGETRLWGQDFILLSW